MTVFYTCKGSHYTLVFCHSFSSFSSLLFTFSYSLSYVFPSSPNPCFIRAFPLNGLPQLVFLTSYVASCQHQEKLLFIEECMPLCIQLFVYVQYMSVYLYL